MFTLRSLVRSVPLPRPRPLARAVDLLKQSQQPALDRVAFDMLLKPTTTAQEAVVEAVSLVLTEAMLLPDAAEWAGPKEFAAYFAHRAATMEDLPGYRIAGLLELRVLQNEEARNTFVEATVTGDGAMAHAVFFGKWTDTLRRALADTSYDIDVLLSAGELSADGDVSDLSVVLVKPTGQETNYMPTPGQQASSTPPPVAEAVEPVDAFARFRRAYYTATGQLLAIKAQRVTAMESVVETVAKVAGFKRNAAGAFEHTRSAFRFTVNDGTLTVMKDRIATVVNEVAELVDRLATAGATSAVAVERWGFSLATLRRAEARDLVCSEDTAVLCEEEGRMEVIPLYSVVAEEAQGEDSFIRYLVPRKSVLIGGQWWTISQRLIDQDKVVLRLSDFALKDGLKPQKPKLMKWSTLVQAIKGGKIGATIGTKKYGPKQDPRKRDVQRRKAGLSAAPGSADIRAAAEKA